MTMSEDIKSPEFRDSELNDLAGIFDAPAEETPPAQEPPAPVPSGEAEEPAEVKPKEEPKKESEGKAWKAIRRREREIETRENKLLSAESALRANEAALAEKARAYERQGDLIRRANAGDMAAWQELGLDIEKANAHYLQEQTGEARLKRIEDQQREANESRKKSEEEARARREEAEEAQRAEHAKAEVWGIAERIPFFAKKGRDKTIQLAEYVAQDLVRQGRRFTFAELVAETERRVMAAIEEDARDAGYTRASAPVKTPPAPIGKKDTGERGAPGKRPYSKDDELDEVAAIFDS